MTVRKALRAKVAGKGGKPVPVASTSSMPAARHRMLIDQARWFDLEADVETQHGHHSRADRLSRRAGELRGQT